MDQGRFDSLARSLATTKSRRGFLGTLAALGAGLVGARGAGAQVTQAQCGNKACKNDPGVCTNGCVCCVYANGNSRCRPPGECTGTVVSPTTTTTPAPTTTTAAPATTSTTTTPHPSQGTCPAGANACFGADPTCNGARNCYCFQTLAGATVCAGQGFCSSCSSDADCTAVTGPGSVCATGCTHCSSGTACQAPCGTQPLMASQASAGGQQTPPNA